MTCLNWIQRFTCRQAAGGLAIACLALAGLSASSAAWAANYSFPGVLPGGCSGSGTSYTCGALSLAASDTVVVVNASTTITLTSLSASSAQINAAGVANLTLTMTGALTASDGATIKANVNAGSVVSSGAVTYGGFISTSGSGALSLGAGTTVPGTLTTVTGAVTLLTGTAIKYTTVGGVNSGGTVTINSYNRINGDTVGYLLSAAGNNVFGGSITSTTTYVSLGGNATVNGSIYSQTYVDIGSNSTVTGSITSATSYIDTGTASTVGGSLNALGTYVDIHGSANIGGAIRAQSYVSMTTNSTVGGNITANSTVAMGSGSTAAKCVRSNNASTITVPSAGAVGGACCGAGSTCTSTCVTGTPKPATCAWPTSGLFAEYRFEQNSYNGTDGEVLDSSGNQRHGKVLGGASSSASGKFCRGVLIPKNLSAVIDAFDTGIDVNAIGNAGTLAFWYKSVTSGNEHRMLYDATSASTGQFYLYRDDEGSGVDLNAYITDGGSTSRDVDKIDAFSDATWVHLVVTWKFTTGTGTTRMRLYVNGAQQDEQTYSVASGVIASAINTLYFGDNRSAASAELNSANGYIDQIKLYDAELTAAEVSTVYAESPTCAAPAGPHHLEVTTSSASGVTCNPITYTVKACANADCSTPYTTGMSGNLVLSGTPTVNYTAAFTIAASSASTTVPAHITTAGTVTAGLSGLSVTPSGTASPYCGMGTAASVGGSCVYTANTAGLIFSVPNHVSDVSQAVNVSAVRSSDNGLVCTPAFASVSRDVTFKCTYTNPTSGTRPVRVGGAALNTGNNAAASCDGTGRAVSLGFNGAGVASTTVQYADVGQMGLTAVYAGTGTEAGLVMNGSGSFVAAPSSFAMSGVTAGTIAAGNNFSATVTARNSSGVTTPNFGRETTPATVALAFNKYRPIGAGAQAGAFSGSLGAFNNGVASSSNLNWSEVGSGDLTATLNGGNYLTSGLSATGTTGSAGAVGPFIPHHFTVEDTVNGCGSFTYSGQPFSIKVKAYNAAGAITQNYDGSGQTSPNQAKAVTLSAIPNAGTGSFNATGTIPVSAFTAGQASVSTPAFTFTSKLTVPQVIAVAASNGDGVSSSGYTQGALALRSGRLKASNVFGPATTDQLKLPVQAQYWTGREWVLNDLDSCTSLPASAVALSNYRDGKGSATATWTTAASALTITGGHGSVTFSAPTTSGTGSVDVALNLGVGLNDQSCLSTHPASAGGALPWMRSQHGVSGACASAFDRDPSARVTFGVYSSESKKTIYGREAF
ncbi:MAG: hypothetical protein EOP40_09725 [Rubrivivax sp.]|nr:MAG: hypothetical protein EOP40_09725 [Rubrivivax sp.]